MFRVVLRIDWLKNQRDLVVVETIRQVVGHRVRISRGDRRQIENRFNVLQDAAKVMGRLRNVSGLWHTATRQSKALESHIHKC